MSYTKCAYHKCDKTSLDVSMFRFPVQDQDRLILWIHNSGNTYLGSLTRDELRRRYICSAHFPESSIHRGIIRNRLVGPAVPVHFLSTENQQDSASTSAGREMETGELSSPEFLKVKTPVKFYRKRSRSISDSRNQTPSPAQSCASSVPLTKTPTRLSRRCSFEGPKKRLSRKCLFDASVNDSPKTRYLKDTASTLLKKTTAQRAQIRRMQAKSKLSANKALYQNHIAKTLAEMQTREKSKKTKWTKDEKNFCLSLFYKSPSAYHFLRRQGVVLAAPSTIRGWLSKLNYCPGLCDDLFRNLTTKFANSTLKEKACIMSFDEMSIMANLEYSKKYDVIEGFEDLGGGRRTSNVAKYALVFVVRGLYSNWKLPLAYFLSNSNVKSDILETLLKSTINKLFHCGLLPKAVVCDQMSTNQKVLKNLGATPKSPFFFVNARKIFAFFDVPHLIKNVRNNLLSSNFIYNNEEISFKDIINTYEIDKKSSKSRALYKITDRHIRPNSFQKMTVSLATQVLSNTVSAAIKTAISTGELRSDTAFATANFIKIVNDMFDSLNSGSKYDKNPKKCSLSKHATDVTQAILDGKITFEHVKKINYKTNKVGVTKTTISRPPCFDGIVQSCEAALQLFKEESTEKSISFIMTKRLNQDVIENLFSKFRQKGGYNRNPTSRLLRTIFRSNFINSLLKLPTGSNCTEDGAEFIDVAATGQSSSITGGSDGLASVMVSGSGGADILPSCSSSSNNRAVANSSDHEVANTVSSTIGTRVTLEQCSTAYFAGYLAKTCLDKFKNCFVCTNNLIKNIDLEDEHQMFILHKSYSNTSVKLKMPSDSLLSLINLSVDCFNCHFESICHKNAVGSVLFTAITKYLECEAKDLLRLSCTEHVEFIIRKMILVKLHFYCKCKKQSVSAAAKLKILKNK